MNPLVRLGLMEEDPNPKLDPGALKKHGPRDYVIRFLFGAVIATVAGLLNLGAGERIGGVLLAFPAILPASLTLIERKDGRAVAAIDATGAVLGSFALIAFALVTTWGLKSLGLIALALGALCWLVVALALYVLMVWLPRRRKSPTARVKPTSM